MDTEKKPFPVSPFVIVAGIAPNDKELQVLHSTLDLARIHDPCEVHVVVVSEPEVAVGPCPYVDWRASHHEAETKIAIERLREHLELHRQAHPDGPAIPVRIHRVVGHPADEILSLAAHLGARSIVVGTHGRRGIKRLLLGSVAEKLVRLATCDVIVARDGAGASGADVSEIQAVCWECAAVRKESGLRQLWCNRHRDEARHYDLVA